MENKEWPNSRPLILQKICHAHIVILMQVGVRQKLQPTKHTR